MQISPARLIFVSIVLGLLMVPDLAQAAANEIEQPKPYSEDPSKLCYKAINLNGLPHKLSTVAGLSAVRQWTQAAMKYGEDYSMWHNAVSASIKCEKFPRSDYYMCFAKGKPCRSEYVDHAAASE